MQENRFRGQRPVQAIIVIAGAHLIGSISLSSAIARFFAWALQANLQLALAILLVQNAANAVSGRHFANPYNHNHDADQDKVAAPVEVPAPTSLLISTSDVTELLTPSVR